MRKRIILRLGILAIVAAGGFLLLVWGMAPDNFTTLERFAMLQGGESAEEVQRILGAPGIDRPGIPRALEGKVDVSDLLHSKEWRTPDGKRIAICFDKLGKAVASARFEEAENWPEKIRRWLRRRS